MDTIKKVGRNGILYHQLIPVVFIEIRQKSMKDIFTNHRLLWNFYTNTQKPID